MGVARRTWGVCVLGIAAAAAMALATRAAAEEAPAPTPPAVYVPTVTLLEAGAPPLRKVRYAFKAGAKFEVRHDYEDTQTVTVDGGATMMGGGSRVNFVLDLEYGKVAKDGTAEAKLRVRKCSGTSTGAGAEPVMLALAVFEGKEVSFVVDDRGRLKSRSSIPRDDMPATVVPFLDLIESMPGTLAPLLPEEPVGKGARWTQTTRMGTVPGEGLATHALTALETAAMTVETEQKALFEAAPDQDVRMMSMRVARMEIVYEKVSARVSLAACCSQWSGLKCTTQFAGAADLGGVERNFGVQVLQTASLAFGPPPKAGTGPKK